MSPRTPCLPRRQALILTAGTILVPVLGGGGLAGCAGLGGPTVITLDEAQLNRLVARQFPQQRRLLEVLDVEASQPRLQLLAERNRLALQLAVLARDRLLGSRQTGRLDFDSALRFEPSDQSLRLTQVRVSQLRLDDASAPAEALAGRLGRVLGERLLEDLSVYQLAADQQDRLRQRGLQPGAVTVTARGVEITLAPLAR